MKYYLLIAVLFLTAACKDKAEATLTANQIVDEAIKRAGGELYSCSNIDFRFRDRFYSLEYDNNNKILKREFQSDTATVLDIRKNNSFERIVDDHRVIVHDTMARKYANSINSVHYFAYLPYGLNDPAVNKKLLGVRTIKDKEYYAVEVTFDQENGGDDFEDVYVYWFDKESFKPDYLAYEFHVDGGGIRFREAYNERYVEGIRFVDYSNYKPSEAVSIYDVDSHFLEDKMELLSKIELQDIRVNAHNCN